MTNSIMTSGQLDVFGVAYFKIDVDVMLYFLTEDVSKLNSFHPELFGMVEKAEMM